MTAEERLDFLQGQMQVLISFCFAVIETHPNQANLISHLGPFLEATLAKISGAPNPEALVEGLQDTKKRLLDYASAAARRDIS